MSKLLGNAAAPWCHASLKTRKPWVSAPAGPGKFSVRRRCRSGETRRRPPRAAPGRKIFCGHEIATRVERRPPNEARTVEFAQKCRFRSRNETTTRVGLDSIVAPFGRREDQNVGTEVRHCRGRVRAVSFGHGVQGNAFGARNCDRHRTPKSARKASAPCQHGRLAPVRGSTSKTWAPKKFGRRPQNLITVCSGTRLGSACHPSANLRFARRVVCFAWSMCT